MAWTPLTEVLEEGETAYTIAVHATQAQPLKPRARLLLAHLYEGLSVKDAARSLGITSSRASQMMAEPAFKAAVVACDQAIHERICRGEFGAQAFVKQNLLTNLQGIQKLALGAKSEAVRLNAALELIHLAGMQPPKPEVTPSVERIMDLMTPDEAETYAMTGEWPERFRDQLMRLPSSVLQRPQDAQVVASEVLSGPVPGPLTRGVETRGPEDEDEEEGGGA